MREPKVVTLWELFSVVVIVVVLMILFFPKKSIETAIASERSNYDLALIYLKGIAAAYPDDPENWIRLLEAQLELGHIDAAEKSLSKIGHFQNIDATKRAYLEYRLLKSSYLQAHEGRRKAKLKRALRERLRSFIESDQPDLWLIATHEAESLQLHDIAYEALRKRVARSRVVDPQECRKLLASAVTAGQKQEAVETIRKAYETYGGDPEVAKLLTSWYLGHGDYASTGRLYEKRYRQSGDADALLEAVKNYFFAKEPARAEALLREGSEKFLDNEAVMRRIIKIYLANGYLKEAHAATLKLLKREKVIP